MRGEFTDVVMWYFVVNLLCSRACRSQQLARPDLMAVSYNAIEGAIYIEICTQAIIHYQPDPKDCATIVKEQVNQTIYFMERNCSDIPVPDLSLRLRSAIHRWDNRRNADLGSCYPSIILAAY